MRTAPLLGVLLLASCDHAIDCDALGEPSLELGQGEASFVSFDDDPVLRTEWGPQGGAHAWIALRMEGIWPGRADLFGDDLSPTVSVELYDGNEVAGRLFGPEKRLVRDRTPPHDLPGLQLRLEFLPDTAPDGDPRDLSLSVNVSDACGTEMALSRDVELR